MASCGGLDGSSAVPTSVETLTHTEHLRQPPPMSDAFGRPSPAEAGFPPSIPAAKPGVPRTTGGNRWGSCHPHRSDLLRRHPGGASMISLSLTAWRALTKAFRVICWDALDGLPFVQPIDSPTHSPTGGRIHSEVGLAPPAASRDRRPFNYLVRSSPPGAVTPRGLPAEAGPGGRVGIRSASRFLTFQGTLALIARRREERSRSGRGARPPRQGSV